MSRQFEPARALLPSVLARLSRESGGASFLRPVWEEVVGAVIARHSRLLSLQGATLEVEVESPRWLVAVQGQEAEILSRLGERMGAGVVTRLAYQVVEPK